MKTVARYDDRQENQASTKLWKNRESTPPWAVTWLTWPILFAFNIGLALRAIKQGGNYSSVLTGLLIADVVVLVTLELLFPHRRQWKMTWRSFFMSAANSGWAVSVGLRPISRPQLKGLWVPTGEHFSAVVKASSRHVELDLFVALVLPEPAVNTGAWGCERTVGLVLSYLIVQLVAIEVVLIRLLVRFAMELEEELSIRLPPIHHHRAFLHVVFDLNPLTRS